MPITGIASYPLTMMEFDQHWVAVNEFDPAHQLVLPGHYTHAHFSADETELLTAIAAVTQASEAAHMVSAQVMASKMAMRERITQFRMTVQLNYPHSPYASHLPKSPNPGAIQTKFMAPFEEMTKIWEMINVNVMPSVPGLTLPGDYTLSNFHPDLNALCSGFQNLMTSESEVKFARDRRNVLLKPLYERMLQYRTAVVLHLPKGNPLLLSVPRLSPIAGTPPLSLVVTRR